MWHTTPISHVRVPRLAPSPEPGLGAAASRSSVWHTTPISPGVCSQATSSRARLGIPQGNTRYKSSSSGALPRARAQGGHVKVVGVAGHTGIARCVPERRPPELGSGSRRETPGIKAPRRAPSPEPELKAAASRSSVWHTTPISPGVFPCGALPSPAQGPAGKHQV